MRQVDRVDGFVHAAVRAYATGTGCPPPPEDTTWVARAAVAGVTAPIGAALQQAGHRLPAELSRLTTSIPIRHLRTMLDLDLVARALDTTGVAWAVTKGPVLREVVYRDPGVRDYADLDLLVDPGDVRRAIATLLEHGATLRPCDLDGAVRSRTAELGLVLAHGTVLDLHWNLINFGDVRAGFRLRTETLLQRRVVRRIGGHDVLTLDDEDLALHTMVHACTSGASSLRLLLDVQQCVRWLGRVSSPEALATRAREHGLRGSTRVAISAAARYLDDGIAEWRACGGAPTPWTLAVDAVSRRRPPSAPSLGSRTAESYFWSTRATAAESIRAFAAYRLSRLPRARGRRSRIQVTPVRPDDPRLETWLRLAEASAT